MTRKRSNEAIAEAVVEAHGRGSYTSKIDLHTAICEALASRVQDCVEVCELEASRLEPPIMAGHVMGSRTDDMIASASTCARLIRELNEGGSIE